MHITIFGRRNSGKSSLINALTGQQVARAAGIPMTHYGITLAFVHGILDRALEPFPLAKALWDEKEDRPSKRKLKIARTDG